MALRFHENVFNRSIRGRSGTNLFRKNRNITTDEKREKIISQIILSHMQKKFDDDNDDDNENHCQVGDHCYCTGKYRGVARSICNLRHRRPKKFVWCYIKNQIMITISSSKES